MTRLLFADDHPIFLSGLVSVIQGRPDLTVVARAEDGEQALAALRAHEIDVAVCDISMARLNGLEVVATAQAEGLSAYFILLTMYNDPAYLRRAQELGVAGYVLKESAVDELTRAIDAVSAGGHFVSPSMQERAQPPPASALDLSQLTEGERVVLRELANNQTSREIATRLGVSTRTIQNHRANICAKLGLRGANRLLQFALENRQRV